ncbi:MAG: hypothetical protein HYZ51_05075 [Candidatus Doudnabacteria bacterium]|nr:hypothetical protein [Candidatus Doudnabacteria bacterium]
MKKRFIKFTAFILALSQALVIFFTPVFQAEAFIVHDPGHTAAQSIWNGIKIAAQHIGNLSLGLPGTGAATRAGLKAGKTACTTYDKAMKIADTADTVSSAAVIAGNAALLAKLNIKIASLTTLRTCYSIMLEAIEKGGTVAGVSGNQALEQLTGEDFILTTLITNIDSRIDRLKEERNKALQELWKGVAIRTLMRVQQRITTNLVNKLVAKYKISNILQYADAAATQVYMIDYINKNVQDGKDQAILRSILSNQGLHDTVYPMIRAKIEQQIQKAPSDLLITSGSFYDELSQYGSPEYNTSFMAMSYENALDVAKAKAAELALQEIQTSQGFIPVRNCTDIMVTQRQYDQDNIRLSYEVRKAEDAHLALLQQNALAGRNASLKVSKDELDIAKAKLDEAQKVLQNFGKTKKAFTPPCGPIVNPGYFVAQSINSFLSSHLGSAANVKSENLPFFANFAESVASNFLTKIITSGLSPNNNLLTDNGYQQSAISPSAVIEDRGESNFLKTTDILAESHNSTFSGEKTANTSLNQYILKWNAEATPNASYIIITGPNQISARRSLLSGQVTVNAPSGGNYVLTVYNAQNQSLDTASFEIPPSLRSGQIDLSGVKDGPADSNRAVDQILPQVDTGPPPSTFNTETNNTTTLNSLPLSLKPFSKASVAGASVRRQIETPRGHKAEKLR